MDPIVPAPVQVTTEPGSWLVLTPGVRVVSDSDPAALGVAVLAAGRLGVELDLTVAVTAVPARTVAGPPAALALHDAGDTDLIHDHDAVHEHGDEGHGAYEHGIHDHGTYGPGTYGPGVHDHDAQDPHEHGTYAHDVPDDVVLRLGLVDRSALGLPPDLPEGVARQAYRIRIAGRRIDVRGTSPLGLTHGVASLVRLAAAGTTRVSRRAGLPPRLPCLEILDHPWLPWRGIAVDLATEPLGLDGLRVVLGVMSALKLQVLHLPRVGSGRRAGSGVLDQFEYAELRAAAESRHVRLLPGIDAVPDAGCAGELVAVTRARRVDVGGWYEEAGATVRAVREVLAAGAGVLAGQQAAAELLDVVREGDVVLAVDDATADLSAVRTAVARGARVLLCVSRDAGASPLVSTATGASRLLDALDVAADAVIGVEAVPARPGRTAPTGPTGGVDGRLLPWMNAVAEVGWSPAARPAPR